MLVFKSANLQLVIVNESKSVAYSNPVKLLTPVILVACLSLARLVLVRVPSPIFASTKSFVISSRNVASGIQVAGFSSIVKVRLTILSPAEIVITDFKSPAVNFLTPLAVNVKFILFAAKSGEKVISFAVKSPDLIVKSALVALPKPKLVVSIVPVGFVRSATVAVCDTSVGAAGIGTVASKVLPLL